MITPYQINCICEHSYYRFIENGRIQQESLRAYVLERCKIALIDPQKSKEKLAAENLAINQKIRVLASKVFDKWLEHYRKRTGVHDWRLYNKMLNLK